MINPENIIEIGHIAVETDSMITAIKVASKACKKDNDHGRIMVKGKYIKYWSLAKVRSMYNEKAL